MNVQLLLRVIPNFAMLADPIVELTRGKMKKYSEIKWDQTHEKCLSLLKDKLSLAPILKYPDFTKEFATKTDASQVGLGSVLIQEYKLKVRSTLCLCCKRKGLLKEPRDNIA